ncbi:hypothetical protein GCM10009868_09480 [Terrabacter aerolatus]|uniref:Uncharacterized protein n=1 Tax=Terrabacter aerolatus TaxID=422442 RepID=A0A512D501_9MICO|nr:hypothetical protein [Terrabacter aerolatus]GEO31555.1 hypothetical protein TAE01_33650 [Terrabacter aerolatus]
MTTTIRPTRQALRVHRSHLATTHRAPLVQRREQTEAADGSGATRTRARAFTPMTRDPLTVESSRTPSADHRSQHHES